MNRKYVFLFLCTVILLVAVAGCTTDVANDTNNTNTPDNGLAPNDTNDDDTNDSDTNDSDTDGAGAEKGEEIINDKCLQCHGINRIETQSKDEEEWRTTINSMIQKGAYLNDDDFDTLLNYLVENYGE